MTDLNEQTIATVPEESGRTAVTVPRVVKFAYLEFSAENRKWKAQCRHCKKALTDKEGVTTAFTK